MTALSPPDIDALRTLLSYDPETGALIWMKRPAGMFKTKRAASTWNARYAGRPAFTSDNGRGYKSGGIFARLYSAHRVAWALHYGEWPTGDIDHINGRRDDNRIANLRQVSNAENARNQKLRRDNTSRVSGVHWYKPYKKWLSYISVDGRRKHLGYFAEFADAVSCRKAAEREFGYHPNHGRSR